MLIRTRGVLGYWTEGAGLGLLGLGSVFGFGSGGREGWYGGMMVVLYCIVWGWLVIRRAIYGDVCRPVDR